MAMISAVILTATPGVAFAAGGELQIGDKLVDRATATPGDSVAYSVSWTCFSNLGLDCDGGLVEDVIPSYTDVFGQVRQYEVSGISSPSGWSATTVGAEPNAKLVWTADASVTAGSTGLMTFSITVPNGLLPAGDTTITNTASAFDDASDTTPDTTNPVDTVVTTGAAAATTTKSNGLSEVLLGDQTTYTVTVCPGNDAAHFGSGYVVTDTVPAGATIIAASDGGTIGANTATWTIVDATDPGYVASTGCFTRTITVEYPAGPFPTGSTVVNNVAVTAGGVEVATGSDSDTIRPAQPNMTLNKFDNAGLYVQDGDPVRYGLQVRNRAAVGSGPGETELADVVVIDGPLPAGFQLDNVEAGTWNSGATATIELSTNNQSSWTTLGTSTGGSNVDFPIAGAGADASNGADRYVRWTFAGNQPVDFAFNGALEGVVDASALTVPLPTDSPSYVTMANSATADANGVTPTGNVPLNRSDTETNRIEQPQPAATADKTVTDSTLSPDQTGTFTMTPGNSNDATADLVVSAANPVTLTDCFPSVLTIDAINLNGWTQVLPTPGGLTCTGDRNPMAFTYASDLTIAPGSDMPAITIDFHVRGLGEPGGPPSPQTVTNEFDFAHADLYHGNFDDSTNVDILLSAELDSKKSIVGYTGALTPWDPAIVGPGVFHGGFDDSGKSADVPYGTLQNSTADTYPGGPVTYQIAVLNSGNAAMRDFSILDTLPHVGDTGVKATTNDRSTEFVVELTGPIVVPNAGWTVQYFSDENPCRATYGNAAGCTGPTPITPDGSTTPWSDVKSFEITLAGTGDTYAAGDPSIQTGDDVFEVGEEIVIQFPGSAEKFNDPEYDSGDTTAFPYDGLRPPSTVDDGGVSTPCVDHNSAGLVPGATTCPVARNSFAYAGVAFGPGLSSDTPLSSEPPQVEVTVYAPPNNGLGDVVWFDADADGVQDAGEAGLPGATVELFMEDPGDPGSFIAAVDADSNPVDAVTTDANGNYVFFNLDDGNYRVRFTPPAGYIGTTPNVDGSTTDVAPTDGSALDGAPNTNDDSDASPVAGQDWYETPSINLFSGPADGEFDPTWDFGVYIPFALGDIVFYDDDGDGEQDLGEAPVVGASVNLLQEDPANAGSFIAAVDADGNTVAAQTTGADGRYLFDFLFPGSYRVQFDHNQAGYVWTQADAAAVDEADDSDATFAAPDDEVATSATVTLGATEARNRLVTAADDTTYAPVWPGGVRASYVHPDVDAGIYRPLAVGDYVWFDDDRDGIQDAGDTPVVGVTVELLMEDPANAGSFIPATDASSVLVPSETTNGAGEYLFDNLLAGTYRVQFSDLPAGYGPTAQSSASSTAANDSNPDVTGLTPAFTLDVGEANVRAVVPAEDGVLLAAHINPTIDMGLWQPYAVGDYVWFDDDRDGIQGAGEDPVEGVVVALLQEDPANPGSFIPAVDINGTAIDSVTTDVDGRYVFDDLETGNYRVQFTIPAGYTVSPQASGADEAVDSNPDPTTGLTPAFAIGDGAPNMRATTVADGAINATAINPTIDMGIWQRYSVGDQTWIDANADGVRDPSESPVAGITVTLLDTAMDPVNDADGNPIGSVTTDANGRYVFDNLTAGDYIVDFSDLPAGFVFTTPLIGDAATDSNPAASGADVGKSPVFSLGPDNPNARPVEPSDGVTEAQLIDPTIDAGIFAPVALGDFTWIDEDLDGLQDAGEPVFPGVTVTLTDADGNAVVDFAGAAVAPQVTDAAGEYLFDNLTPGTYRVQFTLPAGYAFTTTAGDEPVADSNANQVSGITEVFEVWSSETGNTVADVDPATTAIFVDPTIDAGVVPRVAISDRTWIDRDGDGVQDPGEDDLPGVRVVLLNADGTPATDANGDPVAPVVTGADGEYIFDNLLPGEYRVRFELPDGYGFTVTDGGVGAGDSNPDRYTGTTPVFAVAAVAVDNTSVDNDPSTLALFINNTIDAGITELVAVGNYTWRDDNGNGVQDSTEQPVSGVTVALFDGAGQPAVDFQGNPVAPVETDAAGRYVFDNLLPGDYRITFTPPDRFSPTPAGQGVSASGSDAAVNTGQTAVFTLTASDGGDMRAVVAEDGRLGALFINPTIDAGYVSIGVLAFTGLGLWSSLVVAFGLLLTGVAAALFSRRRTVQLTVDA